MFVQCLHDHGSSIDLSRRKINGDSDTKGHTKIRKFSRHSFFFLFKHLAGLLIKLNSRQCLIHICCRSIQIHKGKSMNIFHLHSWKSHSRWGKNWFIKMILLYEINLKAFIYAGLLLYSSCRDLRGRERVFWMNEYFPFNGINDYNLETIETT